MSGQKIKGRRSVLTDDVVRKLESAFGNGLTVSQARHYGGITRSTYYKHLGTNKAFSDKMRRAQELLTILAKETVTKAIKGGNFQAAKWFLEHKASDEFGSDPFHSHDLYSHDKDKTIWENQNDKEYQAKIRENQEISDGIQANMNDLLKKFL